LAPIACSAQIMAVEKKPKQQWQITARLNECEA
jgi:hypothetical protein